MPTIDAAELRPVPIEAGVGGGYDCAVSASEPNPWHRVSRRSAYENPWIELFHDEVIRPDGQPGIYGVVHFRHRAIGVVPLDEGSDSVLLVGHGLPFWLAATIFVSVTISVLQFLWDA